MNNRVGFPCSSVGKESACNAEDPGSIPGSGRSPGEGNGNPLQYSCLENPMERRAWQATVHRVIRVGHDLGTKPPNNTVCEMIKLLEKNRARKENKKQMLNEKNLYSLAFTDKI